jgi:hypothetical protein
MYIERLRRAFFDACTKQSASTKDGTFLLEFTHRGCSISPMIVADVHGPSLQSLYYFATRDELKNDKDEEDFSHLKVTQPIFPGSRVLDALHDLYKATYAYAKNGEFQIFAGGGVKPPSLEHPAIGWGRTMAFPLAQEVVLYEDQAKFQRAIDHAKKVKEDQEKKEARIIKREKEVEDIVDDKKRSDERQKWEEEKATLENQKPKRMKRDIREFDPDSMLAVCMGPDEDSPYYWGGMDYVDRVYE